MMRNQRAVHDIEDESALKLTLKLNLKEKLQLQMQLQLEMKSAYENNTDTVYETETKILTAVET